MKIKYRNMANFTKIFLTSGNQNPPKSLFDLFWISFFGGISPIIEMKKTAKDTEWVHWPRAEMKKPSLWEVTWTEDVGWDWLFCSHASEFSWSKLLQHLCWWCWRQRCNTCFLRSKKLHFKVWILLQHHPKTCVKASYLQSFATIIATQDRLVEQICI